MTYEEKLNITIEAIREAKQFTRKDYHTKLHIGTGNGLSRIHLAQLHDILLQLQDDEKIITVKGVPTALKTGLDQATEVLDGKKNYFLIDILNTFDDWYRKHLIKNKSRLHNIDFMNLLKIYDVVLDIDQKIQIKVSTEIYIRALPALVRFQILFPTDSIGTRDTYRGYRADGLNYLEKEKIISAVKWVNDMYDGNFSMIVDIAKFQDFLQEIMSEYQKRNRRNVKADTIIQKAQNPDVPVPQKAIKTDIKYEVVFTKQREIMVNGITIAKPDFNSENEVVFWFLYENPNKKHSRVNVEKAIGKSLTKSLHKIIENLGFKNDFRKAFFDVSKDTIYFRNPLKQEDLDALGIKQLKFSK